jgi:hypothetical protein
MMGVMTAFVLVHSPVTGPSTWRWVAAELSARGHCVCVPAVPSVRRWEEFADSVATQVEPGDHAVLVGHSGAGPLLPQIAARIGGGPLIFVDADIPPDTGQAGLMPAEILAELRALAVDGMLPPWSEWFGPAAMRELVPDAERRAVIAAELPRLPLSYFGASVPAPVGWAAVGGAYVLLSDEAYGDQGAAAAARGWPVIRLPGGHLDIVTRPEPIAAAIAELATGLVGP